MKKKGQQHTFDAAWQPLPAWQCINGYSYEVGVRNALTSSPHRGDFFSCLINAPKKLLSLEKHAKLLVESPVALNSNSAVESAQRSDHPWQARQQGGGWTINQYRPSRSVHPPWRPASPPGVTNLYLAPRSVPKVRVSAERRCATEPRARATVSSKGVELVLACAPKPAENAVPAQGRPGRTARSGSRDIANDMRLAAWPACASDADDGVAFRQ